MDEEDIKKNIKDIKRKLEKQNKGARKESN